MGSFVCSKAIKKVFLAYTLCRPINTLNLELLSLSTVDIWDQIIICSGGYTVHCRMFSSTPGLYPLDASGTLLSPIQL